jgi:hypothetical protein
MTAGAALEGDDDSAASARDETAAALKTLAIPATGIRNKAFTSSIVPGSLVSRYAARAVLVRTGEDGR